MGGSELGARNACNTTGRACENQNTTCCASCSCNTQRFSSRLSWQSHESGKFGNQYSHSIRVALASIFVLLPALTPRRSGKLRKTFSKWLPHPTTR